MVREGGIGLRRNGKQQACEPCRKGKLACDHTAPHCGRCVRRNTTSRCIYHPAPMTRNRAGEAPITPPTPHQTPSFASDQKSRPGQSPRGALAAISRSELNNSSHNSPTTQTPDFGTSDSGRARDIARALETIDWYGRSWEVDAVFPRSAKYYGPTSFSSVFTENDLLDSSGEQRRHPASWQFGQPLLGRGRPSAPTVRMNQVIRALWNIPSKEICDSLMSSFQSHHHTLMNEVLITYTMSTLWETFGEQLAAPRTPEKLTLIAEVLFKNEEKSLPPTPENGMEWLNNFTGLNLKFEILGMLFCFFGMAYHGLMDGDPHFTVPENHGRDRKQSSWRMKECADICLKMCEISETNNEMSVALMLCTLLLESCCTGDESFQLRRRHADAIVSAMAAGLHRLDYGANKITTALEYKRRIISSLYCLDKNEASMNGVPVSLSQKFCHLRLPADISEEDLFLPPEELETVVSNLDLHGWNKNGEIHRVTTHRAIQLLSRCREEILDIALSVDRAISLLEISDLHERCQQVYDSLPPQIHYYEYGATPKNSTGKVLLGQSYVMLVNLQNRFLIDRVATARGFANDQRLLDTAMEMLELSIKYWVKRDQLIPFYNNFDWIVTCYGIPSSGVICVELLKQSQRQSRLQFSRSDAIQKLTLFIGFLEWIRPTDGNYLLAGRLKNVVRRVVDHILDPPQQPQLELVENGPFDFQIDPMLAPLDANTIDWLSTIDWTQGSWMEYN